MFDRDRQIERYIARQMEAAEEAEFMRVVESDPRLRRMLETEREVRRILLRDRDAISPVDAAGRADFIALLSELPQNAPAPTLAGAAGRSWLSGTVVQGMLVVLAIVGSVLVWNRTGSGDASVSDQAVRRNGPVLGNPPSPIVSPPADVASRDARAVSVPIPSSTPSESPASKPRRDVPPPGMQAERSDHPIVATPDEAPSQPQVSSPPSSTPSSPVEIPPAHAEAPPKRDDPPTRSIIADTMRVDVKLKLEKLKRADR